MEFEAPVSPEVSDVVPREADSFGEGLWQVVKAALNALNPSLTEAARCCLWVFAAILLCGLVRQMAPNVPSRAMELAGVVAVSAILLEPSASLIALGVETAEQLRSYGTLLLPVMTGALAASGGVTASTGLYVGTAFFDSVLSGAMRSLMIPMLWMFLALGIAAGALGGGLLEKLRDLIRWAMEWVLKLGLYLFTGYMAVTGVVSGTADAAASRAAKITISAAVPVVGGILSDAADAVLISAGTLGSSAGIYGILTVLALFAAPFLQMGCQYLLLRLTAALGEALGDSGAARVAADFAGAMGLLMAMVCSQTVLLLISTLCFMKGVAP